MTGAQQLSGDLEDEGYEFRMAKKKNRSPGSWGSLTSIVLLTFVKRGTMLVYERIHP